MPLLPDSVKDIYPNAVRDIDGIPAVVFRDHRWTLPVISIASGDGHLSAPVTVVTFDRHRDLLEPLSGNGPLRQFREHGGSFDDLVELVRDHCSPRDDDWILSGMELGLIGDVVQFSASESYEDEPASVSTYADASGQFHRVFQLGRPTRELTYKGSMVQDVGGEITGGLLTTLGWDPSLPGLGEGAGGFLLDIDLDFFTLGWQTYTLPFPDEVYTGEFLTSCQSEYYDAYMPLSFLHDIVDHAGLITIASEPDFCGGPEKAKGILQSVDRLIFAGHLCSENIMVDYPLVYPDA